MLRIVMIAIIQQLRKHVCSRFQILNLSTMIVFFRTNQSFSYCDPVTGRQHDNEIISFKFFSRKMEVHPH